MSSWQLMPKNWVQVARAEGVASEEGTRGKPILQVGGEQEAVTEPDPGDGVERTQLWMHPVAVANTPGCEALQVRGILLSTIRPLTLGREVYPIKSVRIAVTVSVLPFPVTNVVWFDC
jgi:hypothetical protein